MRPYLLIKSLSRCRIKAQKTCKTSTFNLSNQISPKEVSALEKNKPKISPNGLVEFVVLIGKATALAKNRPANKSIIMQINEKSRCA
jgi:hypothetical protein